MFCMSIDRVCFGTGGSKLCSVCVLTEGALVQGLVCYVLYIFRHWVRWYRGEYDMFCMSTDRG